jgi:hypothetical protein
MAHYGYIREGDGTSCGGVVLEGHPMIRSHGRRIAPDGARIQCKLGCRGMAGTGPHIPQRRGRLPCGSRQMVHEDLTTGGCKLLSSLNGVHGISDDDAGSVAKAPRQDAEGPWQQPRPFNERSPQQWAGASPPAAAVQVVLHLGVFFDGTSNNEANVALGERCRGSYASALGQDEAQRRQIAEHCKPYMTRPGGSYQNGPTNVVRLYRMYQDSRRRPLAPDETDYYAPIYVEGAGTASGQRDTLRGLGLGRGKTGVLARIHETFEVHIPVVLDTFSQAYPDHEIADIEFDVFGFSRGAATARHFVNAVNRKQTSPLAAQLPALKLKPGFAVDGDVRIGFVGLFDTVASMGRWADALNVRDDDHAGVELALPAGCARQVVHLVARDEYRANFMLTKTAPEWPEIVLPGVHSDIGGSYYEDQEGPQLLTKPVIYTERQWFMREGDRVTPEHIAGSRAYQEAAAAARMWRQRLSLHNQDIAIKHWYRLAEPLGRNRLLPGRRLQVGAVVVLDRPINWKYQLIALRLMHKKATEAGVAWRQSPDDIPSMSLPDELQPIAAKLLAEQPLDEAEETLLRHRYLHLSAHWNLALAAKLGPGGQPFDLLYINRPDPSGQRDIKPNQ